MWGGGTEPSKHELSYWWLTGCGRVCGGGGGGGGG